MVAAICDCKQCLHALSALCLFHSVIHANQGLQHRLAERAGLMDQCGHALNSAATLVYHHHQFTEHPPLSCALARPDPW